MENGTQNGVRTNHDREPWINGVNGGAVKREVSPDKGKTLSNIPNHMTNGASDGSSMDVDSDTRGGSGGALATQRMSELPEEIRHITEDIVPLNLLLSRLAQWTHGRLQEEISHLASKPLPQTVVNGASNNYMFTGAEDPSKESMDKKVMILNTMQHLHQKWVKALVITEWSKKAKQVGKLIDIKAHLHDELARVDQIFAAMIGFKQSLHHARLPSPDLKTALDILSSAEVSWMPDLGYLEPPPMTDEQKEAWLEEINTMLSVRLSYDEYDRIPTPFKDYKISDGRVTFRVEGEFEVDLTIGDEDFEKQFWFIDFRFLFSPAPSEVSDRVRGFLEAKVNHILGTDGLLGCYKYLHGFVLTQKITEFCRQAFELGMGRWIDTLKVERLNRAMSIQYWLNRPHSQTTKSWIILGVHSSESLDGVSDLNSTSHLFLRWFRDGKEVKEFDIPFDINTISTENLLTTVIARHVEYLLMTMCNKLLSKPRFIQREARLDLEISKEEPRKSSLTIQLFGKEQATVRLETMTGTFIIFPQTLIIFEGQRKFNSSNNPAEDGPVAMEHLRHVYTMKDLHSRSKSIGWSILRSQLALDELKQIVYSGSPPSREPFQPVWMRKNGWSEEWAVMMSMSLGGDQWFLVQLTNPNPGVPTARYKTFSKIPLTSGELSLSDEFFEHLAIYTTGMIAHMTDLRELHSKKFGHTVREEANYHLPSQIKLPTIYVRLSDMLRTRHPDRARPMPWAKDYIPISFQGIRSTAYGKADSKGNVRIRRAGQVKVLAEARLDVTDKAKFRLLKSKVDDDVYFNPHRGQFVLRLRAGMGTSFINMLTKRIQALERVVDFVDMIRRAGNDVVPETVTLREVVFTYPRGKQANAAQQLPPWRVRLDLAAKKGINVILEKGNPHLRVLDSLTYIARSSFYGTLALVLVFSLPLYKGLEAMEEEWSAITLQHPGYSLHIFPREVGWVSLRFSFPTPMNVRRQLALDIKQKIRRGDMVWHVCRPEHVDVSLPPGAARSRLGSPPDNEFDRLLAQQVWSAKGPGIKSLGMSCVTCPKNGIEHMLDIISKALKSHVNAPPPPPQNPGVIIAQGGGNGGMSPQQNLLLQQQQDMNSSRPNQQAGPAPMPNMNNNRFSQQQRQQQGMGGQMNGQQQNIQQHGGGGNPNRGVVGSKNNAVVVLD